MIYCCGAYHSPLRTVELGSHYKYSERRLEIVVCPICNSLVAQLVMFNIKKQRYEYFRPKRKKTYEFIKDVESGKWDVVHLKFGTKERSGFVYGQNRECKNGDIRQYAVDFNGVKKLVKVVKKGEYGKTKETA